MSLTLKPDSDVRTEAGGGFLLEPCWSRGGGLVSESCWSWGSVTVLLAPVTVRRDLSPAVAGGGNENPAMT